MINQINLVVANTTDIQSTADAVTQQVNQAQQQLQNAIADGLNLVNTCAQSKLLNVPRVLSFCSFNEQGFESGNTIIIIKQIILFTLSNNFAGKFG